MNDPKLGHINVTLSHNPADLQALQTEWETLQAHSANRCLYNSWEWVNLAWQHLAQGNELWLLTARDTHGALIGATALLQHPFVPVRGMKWRQISFLAAQIACDHLDFVCAPGAELVVAQAFLARLFAERRRWDRLHLASLPEGSPTLQALEPYRDPEQGQLQPEICPYISLPSDWETYYNTMLGERRRKNYRRDQRRFTEAFGEDWACQRVTSPDDLPAALEDLVRLHQAKWEAQGQQGAFGTPQLKAFHRAVSERFLARGWLRLYRLVIKGETVAVEYGYAYRGRYYFFIGGWDERFTEYSLGHMMTGLLIREAIAEGLSVFDMHRGNQPYKYYWGAQNAHDYSFTCLASARLRRQQRLLEAARHLWQGAKRILPASVRQRVARLLKRDASS
ncbi:MAG: GNAT family N-acetyltransferase [Aggregatilineales bacterium]